MSNADQVKADLRRQILVKDGDTAQATARRIGAEAGEVLMELAGHEKSSVRLIVLEIAAQYPTPGGSRAILALLGDANPTVRSVAVSSIGRCLQKEVLPNLLEAMRQYADPQVRSALALQIGVVGDEKNVKDLAPYRTASEDPHLAHDIRLAMARLGDRNERDALVARLAQHDAHVRFVALRDCDYVGDPNLAKHFIPALNDMRDVLNIGPPHGPSNIYARVCDVAVQVMASLGYKFSFAAHVLERRTHLQLAEAKKIVLSISNA